MIRQTGGETFGEISTRSSPASSAIRLASDVGTTPTCLPLAPISRTDGIRMSSLMRVAFSAAIVLLLQNRNAVTRDLGGEPFQERIQRHGTQILPAARAHGQFTFLRLPLSDDQQIGCTLQGMFADFKAYFFVSQVRFSPETGFQEVFFYFLGIFRLFIRDGEYCGLHRGEPNRGSPGIFFKQNPDETLNRAKYRAVQHDRYLFAAIGRDVVGAEPTRHGEIHLNGAALPDPADRVLEREFDLRPVERPLPRLQVPGQFLAIQGMFQGMLGLVPGLVRADTVCRAGRTTG